METLLRVVVSLREGGDHSTEGLNAAARRRMSKAVEAVVAAAHYSGEFEGIIARAVVHTNSNSSSVDVHVVGAREPSSVLLQVGPSRVYLQVPRGVGTPSEFADRLRAVCSPNGQVPYPLVDDEDVAPEFGPSTGSVMDVAAIRTGITRLGATREEIEALSHQEQCLDSFLFMYLNLPRGSEGWFSAQSVRKWAKGENKESPARMMLEDLFHENLCERERRDNQWFYRFSPEGEEVARAWYERRCRDIDPNTELAEVARLELEAFRADKERLESEIELVRQAQAAMRGQLAAVQEGVDSDAGEIAILEKRLLELRRQRQGRVDLRQEIERDLAHKNRTIAAKQRRIREIVEELEDPERLEALASVATPEVGVEKKGE